MYDDTTTLCLHAAGVIYIYLFICVYLHTHAHTHTYTYTYIHAHTYLAPRHVRRYHDTLTTRSRCDLYVSIHVSCLHTHAHTHTHTYTHARTHTHTHIHTHTHTHIPGPATCTTTPRHFDRKKLEWIDRLSVPAPPAVTCCIVCMHVYI